MTAWHVLVAGDKFVGSVVFVKEYVALAFKKRVLEEDPEATVAIFDNRLYTIGGIDQALGACRLEKNRQDDNLETAGSSPVSRTSEV